LPLPHVANSALRSAQRSGPSSPSYVQCGASCAAGAAVASAIAGSAGAAASGAIIGSAGAASEQPARAIRQRRSWIVAAASA